MGEARASEEQMAQEWVGSAVSVQSDGPYNVSLRGFVVGVLYHRATLRVRAVICSRPHHAYSGRIFNCQVRNVTRLSLEEGEALKVVDASARLGGYTP